MEKRTRKSPRKYRHIKPGDKFNRLQIDKIVNSIAHCTCDCGNKHSVKLGSLVRHEVKSCGCLTKEIASQRCVDRNTKHGKSDTKAYSSWLNMRRRCYDRTNNRFQYYGAKGIEVCSNWRESFESFHEDMGDPPTDKHSLERIDLNKGYSKDNCIWADPFEQAGNKSNSILIDIDGEVRCLRAWCRDFGLNYKSVWQKLFVTGTKLSLVFEGYFRKGIEVVKTNKKINV